MTRTIRILSQFHYYPWRFSYKTMWLFLCWLCEYISKKLFFLRIHGSEKPSLNFQPTNLRQKSRWLLSKSMQAFMALVPSLYQVNGKTDPPGDSQVMYDKDSGYVLRCKPQTNRQLITFIEVIHVPFNKREAKKGEKLQCVHEVYC